MNSKKPPMGWNSYDYYDTAVTEEQVKANADFMAKHLKKHGWEYIVVDIEWYSYDAAAQREKHQYIPFWKVEMDAYSRLLPCPQRFPSAAGGKGFQPLADYVHHLGLKFGIHIMRGIPRIAAHNHTKILGSDRTANEIASPYSICSWNPDMYGVIPEEEGAGAYYKSLIELYADWGVDFIKCDDVCRMDAKSAKGEIQLLHQAIVQSKRPMVLSLSPGPALVEEAAFYKENANMWRITDDFWDSWPSLLNMFDRCRNWQEHVSDGAFPDCDMLPLGRVGKGFGKERTTRFTKEEQRTMMTLWCIFRSPLMLGAELTTCDDFTLELLTNDEVLYLLAGSNGAHEIYRKGDFIVWQALDRETDAEYLAVFNSSPAESAFMFSEIGRETCGCAKELWLGEEVSLAEIRVIPGHGCVLLKLEEK